MLNALRTILLSALLATSAPAAWADAPVSPVPIMAITEGDVVLIDASGARTLVECREVTDLRMLLGPDRGRVERSSKPCHLAGLLVHPPTGRWALMGVTSGDAGPTRIVSITVSGNQVPLPTDKAGRVKQGDFLILGDRDGVVAVAPGAPAMWTTNGIYREQRPMLFTPDGSRVIVTAGDSGLREYWSWSFGPRPEGIRVLPNGMTDSEGNHLIPGEPRVVLRHPRRGVRLATLDPTGERPWKVGPPLKMPRRGTLTPLVLGDTMIFYREGVWLPVEEGAGCDESRPGSYRRVDLRTGQEREWRRHDGFCSGRELSLANLRRRTVYFLEGAPYLGYRLYEYDLERDETREIVLEGGVVNVFDISVDGQTLLALTYRGLVLHDVVTGQTTVVEGAPSVTYAQVLGTGWGERAEERARR
jgi:hypothetical protein